jgi:hypothetical protein
MSLQSALYVVGLVLTLVAVAMLIVMVIHGTAPGLAELAWVAIALLIASRERRI